MKTLPDYLAFDLDILFVGVNPSIASSVNGHYYANPRNRFWRAFNLASFIPVPLSPETDYRVLEFGIGLTDLARRPSKGVNELRAEDFRVGARVLRKKLKLYRPRIVCFQGISAFLKYVRYTRGSRVPISPGIQLSAPGEPVIFAMPSPSPANAIVSLNELVWWYMQVKRLRDESALPA